uniref:Uncharacterized protein n=1 Tax=Calidris pygmaea TaxID=425635 RepID=A0A8C3KIB2_9CHAR
MLLLVGVLLSCGALCPMLLPNGGLKLLRNILSCSRHFNCINNYMMEEGGDVITYLEGFIKALKNSKEHSKERLIARELQEIKNARKSCLKWMEQDWEPVEEEDFLQNLKNLLKFLNHYAF